ncbi:MAG: hypothetical protein Q4C61_03430 [Lachnospiraceae bacterium]|nr:hypothetical protein [Lachnospiraceae bacterium]
MNKEYENTVSTINGMGRGAGNCSTEGLLGFLRKEQVKYYKIGNSHFLLMIVSWEWQI